jgi:streptogramin lyase/mono/diheme cytochrome c family protein
MNAWNRANRPRRTWSVVTAVVASLTAGYVAFHAGGWAAPAGTAAQQRAGRMIAGTANLSGSVTATKPFKAAQVFIRNVDKSIGYMVYTNAGQFRSVALLPGNYEVTVKAKDLVSDAQKVTLKAGDNQSVKVSLRDFSGNMDAGGALNEAGEATKLTFQDYDEIYPANGPGKQVAEQVCMNCHGENFFPSQPATEEVWNARIDHMQGRALWNQDATSYAQGLLAYRTSMFNFSRQDREDLVAYLVKNFGPGAKPRAVRTDRPMPVDEASLAKAQYIEYYLPPDAPGELTKAPDYVNIGYRGRRVGQDVRFDNEGNVWLVDRGFPHRLVKLDPRTGDQKSWVLPEPKNGIHEVLVDRSGMILLPQHSGTTPTAPKGLVIFNPKTEQFEKTIPMDPDNVVRNSVKWLQSLAIDSKDNVYIGWIMGGAISKYERATGKVSVFRVPTPHAIVYGVVADRNDNIWLAEWSGGKIAKFDTRTNSWTEYMPPTWPGHVRRLNVDYQNNIWWGIWASGNRPGKLVKLDQTTGRMTEYTVPMRNSQPYDVAADTEGNIWFADSPMADRAAAIGKFNTKTQAFTFYPKPQFAADTPKIQVTRDGAVWFSPRGTQIDAPAISVLYPDMDKITTLGAYYVNDAPGYPFKVAPATTRRTTPAETSTARSGQ